ncbi:MAG TPA: manganese efflux pump MntP family protein [Pyrinomonadaceae bacterium]|nr:manganese efflux pump MntP family protein [Pyrinomonadaceae bacterium]
MSFWFALITGVGLSMDAVAASLSSSTAARRVGWPQAFKMAAFFGLFQALMPAIGYACGFAFQGWLKAVDHWVAFALLGFIGAKMIYESGRADVEKLSDPFSTPRLLLLSIATSIDALAVGISFSLLGVSLLMTILVIGIVTFSLCLPAVWIGKRLGALMARRAELIGGLVLIGIGCKILIEHLSA